MGPRKEAAMAEYSLYDSTGGWHWQDRHCNLMQLMQVPPSADSRMSDNCLGSAAGHKGLGSSSSALLLSLVRSAGRLRQSCSMQTTSTALLVEVQLFRWQSPVVSRDTKHCLTQPVVSAALVTMSVTVSVTITDIWSDYYDLQVTTLLNIFTSRLANV